jgi:hypothetical protein
VLDDPRRRESTSCKRWVRGVGVALVTAALCLAVTPAAPSYDGEGPSAAELWEAYPLNPKASDARGAGPRGDIAATRAGRNMAARSIGDESGSGDDSHLMLQLGMLLAALYAAFLCVWFLGTRVSFELDAGDGLRRLRARTAAVGTARSKAKRRFGDQSSGSSHADPSAAWTCAIGWRPGRLRSRFRAMMAAPDGRGQWVVAQSKRLRWPPTRGETMATAELVSALESLVAALVAAGWEPVESGGSWSARRFVWCREGEPPARLRRVE